MHLLALRSNADDGLVLPRSMARIGVVAAVAVMASIDGGWGSDPQTFVRVFESLRMHGFFRRGGGRVGDAAGSTLAGLIRDMGPGLSCVVRLDMGAEIQACIPRRNARVMFRVVPGDRVLVTERPAGSFVVLGHEVRCRR